MSLLDTLTRPVRDLLEGVLMPLRALMVVGVCGVINTMTYSGTWWVKWVALGMGIATAVALGRALRAALILGLVAWVGRAIWKRHGDAARQRFDDWVRGGPRPAAEIVAALRRAA